MVIFHPTNLTKNLVYKDILDFNILICLPGLMWMVHISQFQQDPCYLHAAYLFLLLI